ncbi:MAG: S9 family peptidase [Ignavibacteriota bacterium]|nr:S9 family peptidase [Ignavibacteriota bacterium]MBW7842120.1 S9 family peptidase [Ignavibacterium sp.]MCO6447706.1 S9 family peptidase [Ignavibacterium album]MCZ2268422.1 S9 family peptidase [Ignavibacteriales bacterium]HOJ08421.1 S9 family peptidase [Ignavibacteriaceae bacterium]
MKSTTLFLLFILFASGLNAQKKPFTIEEFYKIKSVGSPVLSNSGERIAYSVTEYDLPAAKTTSTVYVMNKNGSSLKSISDKLPGAYSPFWSVSDDLYLLSKGQLYKYSFDKDNVEQLTDFYPGISAPVVSNDERYVAFTADLFPECGVENDCNKRLDESTANGPVQAYIADNLMFRHWTQYKGEKETFLILYDMVEKKYEIITSSDVLSDTYMLGGGPKYAFSPDSRILAYVSTPEKNIAASTNTDIYLLPIGSKEAVNITFANNAWDGTPAFSPDGNYIAYRTQTTPGFEADRFRVAVYDIKALQTQTLTEAFDYTTSDLSWSQDSKSIYFTANVQGYNPVFKVDAVSKVVTKVTDDKAVRGYQISKDQQTVFLNFSSVDKPGEIYSYTLNSGTYSQITFYNKKISEEVDIRPAEQMWVDGADGIPVHVFIVKPHGFEEYKKYPLIINVHGGPQMQWMDSYRGDWQIYPGSGYVVAFLNPHGSTGYGSKYTEAISKDWGGKVYEDVMKVTEALEKLPYIDSEKMGAMGWSYGGYMMNWLQGHTKKFKCLASMMGVYDLESMWGATEELWFVNWDIGGQPWNSDLYAKYSPSNYVQNFSTPALIITGEKDFRVPYTQSLQYFTTLQSLGIDSRLIVFKNDGHWPNNIKSMPLYYNAHLEWFHKYLGGEPAPYNSSEMVKNNIFK